MPPDASAEASIRLTREEARLAIEALDMYMNSRRFSFKQSAEDSRELHADVFVPLERVQGELKRAFSLD